jgi:hypothetical protein
VQWLEYQLKGENFNSNFRATSEDAFMGIMNVGDAYLGPGVQQTITISNMIVPVRKEGQKVRMTLKAIRDSGFSKREAPPTGGIGGSGTIFTTLLFLATCEWGQWARVFH